MTGVLRCTGEDNVTTGECPAQRREAPWKKGEQVGLDVAGHVSIRIKTNSSDAGVWEGWLF